MKNKRFFSEVLKQHFYSIFFLGVKSAVYKPLNAEAEAEGKKTIGNQTEGLCRLKTLPHWQAPYQSSFIVVSGIEVSLRIKIVGVSQNSEIMCFLIFSKAYQRMHFYGALIRMLPEIQKSIENQSTRIFWFLLLNLTQYIWGDNKQHVIIKAWQGMQPLCRPQFSMLELPPFKTGKKY